MRSVLSALLVLAAAIPASATARPLNIVLTNDDGFESANIRALYAALKQAGHHVIISAPTQNQSGKGGALSFASLGPLQIATRDGSVPAGAPGVGTDPADPAIHYVDGTPVMSMLYGVQIAAPAAFGRRPDLVLSGPNEGNNLGASILMVSGTEANAFVATDLGIPAIAVSGGDGKPRSYKTLSDGTDPAVELAGVVVQLLRRLDAGAHGGPLLPPGIGLNVNVPKFDQNCTAPHFAITRFGTGSTALQFANTAPTNTLTGIPNPHGYPGLSIARHAAVSQAGNTGSETAAVLSCSVAVTPFAGAPDAADPDRAAIARSLDGG